MRRPVKLLSKLPAHLRIHLHPEALIVAKVARPSAFTGHLSRW